MRRPDDLRTYTGHFAQQCTDRMGQAAHCFLAPCHGQCSAPLDQRLREVITKRLRCLSELDLPHRPPQALQEMYGYGIETQAKAKIALAPKHPEMGPRQVAFSYHEMLDSA